MLASQRVSVGESVSRVIPSAKSCSQTSGVEIFLEGARSRGCKITGNSELLAENASGAWPLHETLLVKIDLVFPSSNVYNSRYIVTSFVRPLQSKFSCYILRDIPVSVATRRLFGE